MKMSGFWEKKRGRILIVIVLSIFVFLLSNINAIVDRFIHPEIPYFDDEHIIVGAIAGIITLLLSIMVYVYIIWLQKTNNERGELLKELTIAKDKIEKNNSQLEKLNADKDRFMSILAHDLKSPFHALLGLSGLLVKNIHTYDIVKTEEFVNRIHNSAQNNFNLLEDLLVWSQFNLGNLPIDNQVISFNNVCTEAIYAVTVNADNKNIMIDYDLEKDLTILGDANMLKTVLRNLLSNAIKFTRRNGKVSLRIEEGDKELIVKVKDNGVGIRPEDLSRLFDIGQMHTTKGTEDESGTGMGLLLCKEFVEKHNGRIWATSQVDIGSEFVFTMSKIQ